MKQEYRICLERFKKTGNISEECGQDISQDWCRSSFYWGWQSIFSYQ
jgi:hypothetical protein